MLHPQLIKAGREQINGSLKEETLVLKGKDRDFAISNLCRKGVGAFRIEELAGAPQGLKRRHLRIPGLVPIYRREIRCRAGQRIETLQEIEEEHPKDALSKVVPDQTQISSGLRHAERM